MFASNGYLSSGELISDHDFTTVDVALISVPLKKEGKLQCCGALIDMHLALEIVEHLNVSNKLQNVQTRSFSCT